MNNITLLRNEYRIETTVTRKPSYYHKLISRKTVLEFKEEPELVERMKKFRRKYLSDSHKNIKKNINESLL
jgi:hypothetical protein